MRRMLEVFMLVLTICTISGCHKSQWKATQSENAKLRSQVAKLSTEATTLKAEIAKLQETAQYHFQKGQDDVKAKKFTAAIAEFQTVVDKYPMDPLVGPAERSLAAAQQAFTVEKKHETEVAAAAERARKKEGDESGQPIDYLDFYTKAETTGLPLGKRYRFHACIDLEAPTPPSYTIAANTNLNQSIAATAEFDNVSEYKTFLGLQSDWYCGVIVAGKNVVDEYGDLGIAVYRLH